ncbi:choice-of-anchor G family protein [Sanguibacter inulinus]|uniref:Choice-of-anchor G family protein n=1 Tax=Sanguibacter inulinus TaxID=60922 RepID=A0A853ES11_9MICO|nr:choice-of-anchor G family protein [Sanguibacter inulinus]MBF0722125.1 choice-of-anchor G family protein [Sanguibacter inulinus]NYS93270.1 choice-of-anchor G family protein [Sanguibacter inulinus]
MTTRRRLEPLSPGALGRVRWDAVLVCLLACVLVVGGALRAVPTLASWTDQEWTHGTVGTSQIRCGTDTNFRAQAQAKALGGSFLGTDLEGLAAARGMSLVRTPTTAAVPTPSTATDLAPNDGDPTLDTYGNPLAVTGLTGITGLTVSGLGTGLPMGSAGALNQVAQVTTKGRAAAASGLVDATGAVLVGASTPANQLPQPAVLDLSSVFSGITNVTATRMSVGATGSNASLDFCSSLLDDLWGPGTVTGITRSYGVAGLGLQIDSPTVAALVTDVNATVTSLGTAVTALGGANGQVAVAITNGVQNASNSVVTGLTAARTSSTVTVSTPNFTTALGALRTTPLTDGKVTVDLVNGRVTVNLATLLGSDAAGLNGLAPNSSLQLSSAAVASIGTRVDALVQTWSNQVSAALLTAVRAVTVTSDVTVASRTAGLLDVTSTRSQHVGTIGAYLDRSAVFTPVVTETGLAGVLNPILSALMPGLTVNSYATRMRAALPAALLTAMNSALTAQPVGQVTTLGTTLTTRRGTLVTAVQAVANRMPGALAISVNVQPDVAGAPPGTVPVPGALPYTSPTYSVTALRIGVVSATAPTGFAYLSWARSTVGPVVQVR